MLRVAVEGTLKAVATDRDLLVAHAGGDAAAFAELVRTYRAPVYGYLVRTGVPHEARDDLFQEIFLKIHRAAESYASERALKPWIFTIAANTVRSHYRKVKVRGVVRTDDAAVDAAVDTGPTSEQSVTAKETAAWLDEEMRTLPLEQREALLLAAQQLSMKEIAEALEMPINTVKTTLRRARMTLAAKLARRRLRTQREAE